MSFWIGHKRSIGHQKQPLELPMYITAKLVKNLKKKLSVRIEKSDLGQPNRVSRK